MLSIKEIENILNCSLSEEKKQEILKLDDYSDSIKRANLIGQQFNRLLVIGKGPQYISPGGAKQVQWWCICNCPEHNIILARTCNLNSKNTKSCGCLNLERMKERATELGHKAALDITNQRFGKLVAIERTEKRHQNSIVWKCQCDCGNVCEAPTNALRAGRKYSCGCLTESKASFNIKQFLIQNNIEYITEKTFETCKFLDTNNFARFDFYLPKYNLLIEYDGEQHFQERDRNYFKDSLEKRQEHDTFKTQWCQNNQIKLLRISYKEQENIEEILKKELKI